MHLKLTDQQLKTTLHTYKLLCLNLIVTIKQKTAIDTDKKTKQPNTTLKMEITAQEKRTKEEKKKKDL